MAKIFRIVILLGILGIVAACQPDDGSTPVPTEVALVRRIATLAPTATLDPNAQRILPTSSPTITPIPSPTAYIGLFIGEVPSSDDILSPRRSSGIGVEPVDPDVQVACPLPIDPVFGTGWQSEGRAVNGLGCPIQEMFGFSAKVQIFEGGVMYLREPTGEVWAIAPGGLAILGRHWSVSQIPAVSPTGLEAPQGFYVPQGLLGAVWATVPAAREALGYASTEEQEVDVNIQRFDGGTLFLDVTTGQVFALLVNGNAFGPY